MCLDLIRKLLEPQQGTKQPTNPSGSNEIQDPLSDTCDQLAKTNSRSPSSRSSTSDDSDEFRVENLVENSSPIKPLPEEYLPSNDLLAGLDYLPTIGFAERHDRVVGPDISEQGRIFKLLKEAVNLNPDMFSNSNNIKTKKLSINLNESVVRVRSSTEAFDNPGAHDCDSSSGAKDLNHTHPQERDLSHVQVHNSAHAQDHSSSNPKEPSDTRYLNPSAEIDHNPTGAQERSSSAAQHLELPASVFQPPKFVDTTSAVPPDPSIQDRPAFCFNAPQKDAIQIEFESLPGIREDSIPVENQISLLESRDSHTTVQVPNSPASQNHPNQKAKENTMEIRNSKSNHRPNGQRKGFCRTTSGFLFSSSEESSPKRRGGLPPVRGKRAIKKAPVVDDAQAVVKLSEVNDARPPNSEDLPGPDHRKETNSSGQHTQASRNQRGRPKSRDYQSSESDEDQSNHRCGRRHHHNKDPISTPPSPIPVPRDQVNPSEGQVILRERQKSSSPSPSQKRKKRPSEVHSAARTRQRSASSGLEPARKRKVSSPEDHQRSSKERRRPSSKKKSIGQRRKTLLRSKGVLMGKNFWTVEEENLLIKEVEKHYHIKSCMAHIISRHGPNGSISQTFAQRTSVNLKDKAINLSTKWHTNNVKLSERRQRAFARFPPKVVIKQYDIETETGSETEDIPSDLISVANDPSDRDRNITRSKSRPKSVDDLELVLQPKSLTPFPEPFDLIP